MKTLSILILIVAAVLTAGCAGDKQVSDNRVTIVGSGKMVSREVAANGFDRLEINFAFDVTIRQGDEFKVTATIDDSLAEYLHLVTEGDTLLIGLKPGFAYDIPAATMRAEVVMPKLTGLALNGSSRATLVDVEATAGFAAELAGSSALQGKLDAAAADFKLYGSALARLSGTSQRVTIDICGNSLIDLRNFRVEDARVEASCNATVFLDLDGQLIAEASQHAQLIYRGQPALREVETVQRASVRPE